LILISDVDEIPSVETITNIKREIKPNSLFCLLQHEFCYYLNYYHNSNWLGTCCFLYGKYSNTSLNAIRFAAKRDEGFTPKILKNGGWHFTSLGGVEAIKLKISSWGHREYNNNLFLKSVEYNVKHGYDIFRRPGFGRLTFLNIDDLHLPSILNDFKEKYFYLIGPPIVKENLLSLLFYRSYFKFFFRLRRLFNK
jgi:beta-1,4-mannosyl-glycoprotein beta-1,4-N-acetylglucosaminyltransferase